MPIPRFGFREIAADIQTRIESGEYPPGEPIPSYAQLAQIYGVGVTTAQRSVTLLKERGLVVGVLGRGVYVSDQLVV